MAGEIDEANGRAKEPAGALSDDDLANEGKTSHAAGTLKDRIDDLKDRLHHKSQ